jgi:type VI secretion system protein
LPPFEERTLLERLARGGKGQVRTLTEDTNAIVRSILRNLQKILNTRQGHAPAQLDFGIPAPSDITTNFPESIPMMQKIIRDSIEKYEPRLTGVNVVHVESEHDVLSLRFQITARLATAQSHAPVFFDTLVNSSGHIKLQS